MCTVLYHEVMEYTCAKLINDIKVLQKPEDWPVIVDQVLIGTL